MNELPLRFLSLCILFLGIGCSTNTPSEEAVEENMVMTLNLPDNEAGEAVRKAIDWAGGWEAYHEKKSMSYTKIVQYFDSTGTQEREVRQQHQYRLRPFGVRITWEDDGDQYLMINNGEQAWKVRNDTVLTDKADVDNAWNSTFGSHYVVNMPFKLADPGTVLTYAGLDTLQNGKVVHVIETTYEEGAGSTAGMHRWWYYIDAEDYSLAANFLDYGNGHSYTQYEAFEEVNGIKINKERHSYPANADRELQYLRTKYRNENIHLSEDPLDDQLFASPEEMQ